MLDLFKFLKGMYNVVRLVDVSTNTEFDLDENGNVITKPNKCFSVWGKDSRCDNCISAKVYASKGQLEKFEFIGSDVYFVIAKYIEYKGSAYILEIVSKIDNQSFTNSIDRHLFVKQIQEFDKKLYTDALTGAHNRLYYEEQLQRLDGITAVAIFDIDKFKAINDNFGHMAGDAALKAVSEAIQKSIRGTDMLIRYGGDEFILIFAGLGQDMLYNKLEQLRKKVEAITFAEYGNMHVTISIGGTMSNKCDEATIKRIDEALYKAKDTRNKTVTI